MAFGTVQQAIEDIRNGKFVVVADDEDRENEGDLVCAAQLVTPDMVNFMLGAKGMICVAMTPERVVELGLTMQARENTEAMNTAFTQSIDAAAKYGVMSIPTLMVFKNGEMASRQVGAAPKQKLQQWISSSV